MAEVARRRDGFMSDCVYTLIKGMRHRYSTMNRVSAEQQRKQFGASKYLRSCVHPSIDAPFVIRSSPYSLT